ncbi:MAG: phospho-sugar mutase [Bacteroidales bacterium]|nr:phospho-sugar mutase [Bacteroidales bacterium]
MAKLEFGTGGIRGIMGEQHGMMNRETVAIATQGLANYILTHFTGPGEASVCISYDSRNNSKEFARVAMNVLSANGIRVYLFENIRPTPELSYAVRLKKAIAGIMITASHNPKEYNGYKVFWSDGAQITSPVDKEIVAEVNKLDTIAQVNMVSETPAPIEMIGRDVDEPYVRDVTSLTLSPESRARHSDLKFVYTPLHGCGVRLVPECLNKLGFNDIVHVQEQDVSDGDFPTVHSPNPEEQAALKMAIDKAYATGADIVMATDPDADRMGIAVRNELGEMVLFNGNQTASLLTWYILTRWKELGKLTPDCYIVKTIVTTELIREIAESFGVKCYNVLTGFKYIAEVVRVNEGKGTFICGGEESYGFNAGEFVRDKDAQLACSMVADCAAWAADQGLTLYQLMQKIYKEYGYRKEALVSVVRQGEEGKAQIAAMMDEFRSNPPQKMCGSPVVKVVDYLDTQATGLPSSNVLQFFNKEGDVATVRPSGTEPKIKFYFGSKGDGADAKIEELKKQFAR